MLDRSHLLFLVHTPKSVCVSTFSRYAYLKKKKEEKKAFSGKHSKIVDFLFCFLFLCEL